MIGIKKRKENFNTLHIKLKHINKLTEIIQKNNISSPLYYPLLVANGRRLRIRLINEKIFIPKFWDNIQNGNLNILEKNLVADCVLIPIDHRWSKIDMARILNVIEL